MAQQIVLCDTGVLSRYFGGELPALALVDAVGVDNIRVNPVIRMELLNWLSGYASLTRPKRAAIQGFIKALPLLHLNTDISELAVRLSDANINSKPGDTLIAATALHDGLPLLTMNRKDFVRLGVPMV